MTEYLQHRNNFDDPALASAFDELTFWSARFGALLFRHLEIRPRLRILDVGCATGFPLFELAQVFGRTCEVKGIDVWPEALARAREKLRAYGLPNVEVFEADAARQPFDDATFDLIVSNLGVNNFAEPEAALRECFRVAKRGARVVLTTNVKGHYREFYEVYREALSESGRGEYLERLEAQENHRGTRETATALLRGAGFELVKVVEDGFEMRFADGSALLNHRLTKLGFLDGWRGVVGAEDESEVFTAVERKLNERAGREGELRMSVPMLYLEARKPWA